MRQTIHMLMCSLLLCCGIEAAAPLTHLYLAELWSTTEPLSREAEDLFFKGSTFPDIRYLAKIPRDQTHEPDVQYQDVLLATDYFTKGRLLHCYVDTTREALVLQYQIYEVIRDFGYGHEATLLKLIEDEILYDQANTDRYRAAFRGPLSDDERASGIDLVHLERWNQYLNYYLSQKPSQLVAQLGKLNRPLFNVSPAVLTAWSEVIPGLARDPVIQTYFATLIENFRATFALKLID